MPFYSMLNLSLLCSGHCSWITDHLDAMKGILIHQAKICHYGVHMITDNKLFLACVLVCLHILVLMHVAVCVTIVHNTLPSHGFGHDLPHLGNSDSHYCDQLWNCVSSPPRQCPELFQFQRKEREKGQMYRVYQKVQLTDCLHRVVECWIST